MNHGDVLYAVKELPDSVQEWLRCEGAHVNIEMPEELLWLSASALSIRKVVRDSTVSGLEAAKAVRSIATLCERLRSARIETLLPHIRVHERDLPPEMRDYIHRTLAAGRVEFAHDDSTVFSRSFEVMLHKLSNGDISTINHLRRIVKYIEARDAL